MGKDDWQPGDLVQFVGRPVHSNLRRGAFYLVESVHYVPDFITEQTVGLCLYGVTHPIAFERHGFHACDASYFRKIRPHQPDAEDAETIALLTGKPAKVTA